MFKNLRSALARFMEGRYGTDKLNMAILTAGIILCLFVMVLPFDILDLVLTVLSYVLMGIAIFRMLSRNTYKRYQENRRYLMLLQRLKDKDHRYFACPRCRQSVRVPRGKGKITVTCRGCGASFQEKS